jgi:hypothetical protein
LGHYPATGSKARVHVTGDPWSHAEAFEQPSSSPRAASSHAGGHRDHDQAPLDRHPEPALAALAHPHQHTKHRTPLVAPTTRVFLQSHKGIGVGTLEKVECLGSGADAKAPASVPDVCPDCVGGKYE